MYQNKEGSGATQLEPRIILRWQRMIESLRAEIQQRPTSEEQLAYIRECRGFLKIYKAALQGNLVAIESASIHYRKHAVLHAEAQYHYIMLGLYHSVFDQKVTAKNKDTLAERLVLVSLALYLGRYPTKEEVQAVVVEAREQVREANLQRPIINMKEEREKRKK